MIQSTIKRVRKKKYKVTVGSDKANLVLDYTLGSDSAKIVLYNSASQKIREYNITGSAHTILIYNMEEKYIYDLFINRQFIKTAIVNRADGDDKSVHRKWSLMK